MIQAAPAFTGDTAYDERRNYQRVDVDLLGRFMLESMQEFPCRVANMSPGDAAILTPVTPATGERVILYIDHIGRLEGAVMRHFAGGFAISLRASDRKREKLAAQLTWLANRHELDMPEDRRHSRVLPHNNDVEMTLPDQRTYRVGLLDLSLSGAAVACDVRPAIGSRIVLGTTPARVVRHLEGGFAVEFAALQTEDSIVRNFG